MNRLMIVCLGLFLTTSCARYVQAPLNPGLTKDCDRPELHGNTYRDVFDLAIRRGQALEDCTDRMRTLRK